MKSTVFTVIAVLLICATAQFAAGDFFTVRNDKDKDVWVCYVYADSSYSGGGVQEAWLARGHYKVAPGESVELPLLSTEDELFLLIKDNNGQKIEPRGSDGRGQFYFHPHKSHSIFQKLVSYGNWKVLEGSSPIDGLEKETYYRHAYTRIFNVSGDRYTDELRPADEVTIDGLSLNKREDNGRPIRNYKRDDNGRPIPNSGGNAFILFEQYSNTCGTTCLEMVLHYYGIKVTLPNIWHAGGIQSVELGTWPNEMQQALNGLGVPSDWYELKDDPFGYLRYYVDQDRPPCIILKYVNRSDVTYHWVVVVGYNSKTDEYLIADPGPPEFEWLKRRELDELWGFKGIPKTRGRYSGPITKGWRKEWATDFVASPYTVIVPQSAQPRSHLPGYWSEMLGFTMTGTGRIGGNTRGWEKTLPFKHKFDSYRVDVIELLSSAGTAELGGYRKVGEKSVKLWGRIEDGLIERGRMWVIVRAFRKEE